MKLTRQFIMDNRTPKGSWTRSQIEALGLKWPPLHGWIDTVIGKELTDEQVRVFSAKTPAKAAKSAVDLNQMGLFD